MVRVWVERMGPRVLLSITRSVYARVADQSRGPALGSLVLAGILTILHYHGNLDDMTIAHSRLTAQGQISVPAEVRRKLGVGPGSVIEWEEDDDRIVVRRAGRYTSDDLHRAAFPDGPPRTRTLAQLKDGIRGSVRKRRARG